MSTSTSSLSTGSSSVALAGLASGFDWQSLITQMVAVERQPETQLQAKQSTLQQQKNALGTIKNELAVLQTDLANLKKPDFFDSRTATASDTTLATATAASGTALGSYNFSVSQLATAAALQGAAGAGAGLSATDNVSSLVLNTAGFSTPVTGGTFTVNGAQVTISTGDTLQGVFDKINSATGGAVTASYSSANDQISLSSSSTIVLGSATDTSNFLQAAKLYNNNSGTVTSYAKLGAAATSLAISKSNLATAVTGDANGDGSFTINGVTIKYNTNSDSVDNVLSRINDSGAGVIAAYDQINNRFSLTNKTTGDIGIAVQDGAGSNFLAATGLSTGSLLRGNNLLYQVNNGPQLSSLSNTIAAGSAGITGLGVTALKQGAFTVKVGADTSTIKTAISSFVTEYNKVQSVIAAQTASTTDASGKVTAGLLTGDMQTEALTSQLRNFMTSAISQLSGSLRLTDLGFTSSGQSDSLSTTDLSGLDKALANNLGSVKDLFSNSSNGLAVKLDSFLTSMVSDTGPLVTEQNSLTDQSKSIDTQISHIESQVQAYQQQMTSEFVAMEAAQAKTNQQLQYLQKTFA